MSTLSTTLKIYWKTLFMMFFPFIILPVCLINTKKPFRCMYILLLMAGYWVTECLPLGITGLIPMILGPSMGISDSQKLAYQYLVETNMMMIAGLILALAIEDCGLHRRIAINVLNVMGGNIRLLHFGLVLVTVMLSMWISNTAAVALICPIIEATLIELEEIGVIVVYTNRKDINPDTGEPFIKIFWKPSRITIGFFLSAAYSSSIGGMSTIVGSGTNLAFKGIFETEFPNSPGVSFDQWISLCIVMVIVKLALVWVFMEMLFFGLCRPNSTDAKMIKLTPEGKQVMKNALRQKKDDLGKISFREVCIAIVFVTTVVGWLFKDPSYMTGWGKRITDHVTDKKAFKLGDSTAGFIVIIFLFIVPRNLLFFKAFKKDPEERPPVSSEPLLTWKVVQKKLSWSVILLLGSGFTMSVLTKDSGLNKLIGSKLKILKEAHWYVTMCIGALVGSFLSEFTSNVAVANIALPIFAEIARSIHINPYFLMYPVGLACSHAFLFPVGTPPNALVAAAANIPISQMVIAGLGVNVICYIILVTFFPMFAMALKIYPKDFPDWAKRA